MLVLVHSGTKATVGQYGIALALASPVMAFANLQLRGLQGTDANDRFKFSDYFGLRVITTLVAFPTLILLAISSGMGLETTLVTLLVAARLAIFSISDVFYGFFQRHERLDEIAQATVWTNLLNIAFFGLLMLATGSLILACGGSALAALLVLVLRNIPAAKKLNHSIGEPAVLVPVFNRDFLSPLFLQALPLAVISLLISLNANIPRFFIERSLGLDELGVFVALISLVIASDTFIAAFSQTISPRLARYFSKDDFSAFIKLLSLAVGSGLAVALLAIPIAHFFGPVVVSWVYEPTYSKETEAITWLAISGGINMIGRFVANATTVLRILYAQVFTNLLSVAILIVACWVLVPTHGIAGAAMAIVAASFSKFMVNLFVLAQYLRKWQRASG